MYAISNNYKNELEQKTSLKTKSKIVVDNVEYVSKIKTTPKVTHKNSAMIGGFPIKTCSFEIYDVNGNLDFKDKEITIYKGIEINGVMEYVPQGIFIPRAEQITTNVSQKTISFKDIQDKGQLFSDKYESLLDWSNNETHTGLEIVQEICTKLGIELETTNFNWYDYDFKQPNFDDTTTYREVISRLAEIGGAVAFISRNGKLTIKNQYNTNHTVSNSRYIKLSKEQQFGLINVVTLGKKDMNNDISYPTIKPENIVEWKILDNPFVDLYKEEMINAVANYIIGMSIIPFELTDFVDGFCYDLNDTIKITDKKGNFFNGVILNYETTSRIRSTIGADVQEKSTTDYKLAGSSKENIGKVKLDVDHIKNEINAVIETQEEQSQKLAQIELDNKSITAKVSESETKIISLEQSISKYQTELDIYNITIPVDSTRKPIENKDYLIGYKTTFENNEVESLVSSQSSCSGITFGLSNNKITLSVLTSTTITNLTNEFVIDFSYSKESTTYTDSKKIIVSLSLKGENGAKGDKGDKGEKGDQGEQGIQGEKGLKGDTGDKGDTGSPGKDGTNGTNGKDGKDGTSYYVHIRYSSNSNGNPMTEAPTSSSKYMGIASSTSSTAPTSYSSYKWSLIKGADGTNGVNGKDGTNGTNGKNSYFHIKYSNDGVNFTTNDGNDVGRYIGSYTDFNETASTNFSDYSWQDTAIVVDEELNDLQNQINDTNKDLNNNYTNNTELNQKLEEQKTTIMTTVNTTITQTKESWQADVVKYINENGVEKFVNTLVTIDADGLKLSKSDEDIVSLLNNKGLYVSDGKLREDLANLLMKVDRAGALFKLLEILGTIKEQGIIQKEKITDEKFGECQAWYWIGSD